VINLYNITWASIINSVTPCPTGPSPNLLLSECKVWSNHLVGSLNGHTIIELISTTASHPISIQTVTGEQAKVQPVSQKIDVIVSYPWALRQSTLPNPKIGLAVWSAGLSVGEPRILTGMINYVCPIRPLKAYFGWNANSFVYDPSNNSSQPSVVYDQSYPGNMVLQFICGDVSSCVELKDRVNSYNNSGWKSTLSFFSWDNCPTNSVIMWDPVVSQSFRILSSITTGILFLVFFWLF